MKKKSSVQRQIKTIRQYSEVISNFTELQEIAERYTTLKNYVFSRYSGINSITKVNDHRKQIRDVWVANNFGNQFGLQGRYWKIAIDDTIGTIKANWTNTKKAIREYVYFHKDNFTEDENHYIMYILKVDKLYQNVLTHKEFETPKVFIEKEIRYTYLHSLICRLTRKYKGKIPYSNKQGSFMLDSSMYTYKDGNLEIMGLLSGKRIVIPMKDKQIFSGNLRIVLHADKTIEVHKAVELTVKKLYENENVVGIDKGYRTLLVSSEGREYGLNLNDLLSKETERLNIVNAKRNQLYALEKKYRAEDNIKKADNILKNNLGKVKYSRQKHKYDAKVKTFINQEINKMFAIEQPSTLVMENLDFVNWNDRYPKSVKRKLSRWLKGYLKERLEYKSNLCGTKIEYINPAYTSQECSMCGHLGMRKGSSFSCSCGNKEDADRNAAKVIKKRLNVKEITLYTPYIKVKELLLNRN